MLSYNDSVPFDAEHLPNIQRSVAPLTLNFSFLEDYFECPYRFKLSLLYGFVQPLSELMGYGNTLHEIVRNINLAVIEGRKITDKFIQSTIDDFPIQIWKLKEGVSAVEGDKNYDLLQLACKVTAKRFFPNFLNLDASFNRHEKWDLNDPKRYEYEVATMGCRTRVFENRHGEKTSIGRGNCSFTTINLVKIALECREIKDFNERIKTFYQGFNKYIDITVKQLKDRYEFQKTAFKSQFPLLMSGLWNDISLFLRMKQC